MKRIFVVLMMICAMAACRSSSNYILHPDTMKVVMWDMLKVDEAYTRMTVKDSLHRLHSESFRMYEEVYALHHITKKQFDSTYKYYEAHPVEFKTLLDSLESYAQRERNKPGALPAPAN